MLIYGRLRKTDQAITSSLGGIEKGPWFEKKEDALPRTGELLVSVELEQGWVDWVATRLAFNPAEPNSEIRLFPGAKFAVISVEE
jgi:hypothetical protein